MSSRAPGQSRRAMGAHERERRREQRLANVAASLSRLHAAKRAADESLRRAQDAPGAHMGDNTVFVILWEAHLDDREALLSATGCLDASLAR